MLHKLVLFSVRGTANVYEYQEAEVIQDFLEGEYHRNAVENILFLLKKGINRDLSFIAKAFHFLSP